MKNFYTICLLLLSIGVFAQEAGKAGELLKNEVKDNEINTQLNSRHATQNNNVTPKVKNRKGTETGRRSSNSTDYRWNYNYGNAEVFLRIPENGRFTVEIGDQMMSNATGKFRFFELPAGSIPISIYDDNFLIYRTRLLLRNNTRTVLDFFSDYGLYLLGNFPQQNQAYGVNEWDDIWNSPYMNQQNNWNGNQSYYGSQENYGTSGYYGNVMSNQEFSQLLKAIKRDADFDDSKIGMISSVAQHSLFNSEQVYSLVKTLSFEKGKLEVAKQLYPKCVDKQNFYQVYKAFSFDSSKRELSAFISNG
ncbi:DUF4476 domain-containing protein [Flavobacterium sp. SM2513]|uniref:DUF4476 domain-containing protein n=1 Tax=Flavobacterium sp. SM2513 TaxID=3424766 RepID=UPI003D7FE46B